MWLALIAIVGAAAFLAAGHRRPRFQQPLLRSGLAADVLHAFVNGVLLDVVVAALLRGVAGGVEWALGTRLQLLADAALWEQALVFLFAGDLLKWVIHMMHHRIPVLWRLHRLHHSTRQMDSLSHARSHPLEFLLNRVPFLATFVIVFGIDVRIIAAYSALDLLQGLWVHSNTHVRLGRLHLLIATQEFHHWHHADDPAAVNKNFGGFLSIWDWVFGTAYCPRDRLVPRFGIADAEPARGYLDHLLLRFESGARGEPDVRGSADTVPDGARYPAGLST